MCNLWHYWQTGSCFDGLFSRWLCHWHAIYLMNSAVDSYKKPSLCQPGSNPFWFVWIIHLDEDERFLHVCFIPIHVKPPSQNLGIPGISNFFEPHLENHVEKFLLGHHQAIAFCSDKEHEIFKQAVPKNHHQIDVPTFRRGSLPSIPGSLCRCWCEEGSWQCRCTGLPCSTCARWGVHNKQNGSDLHTPMLLLT